MPAGTDLQTWNPRIGDTGEDRYRFPDLTKIPVGPSNIYSDPPTLDEVNNGSGINQIIAEINRRTPTLDDIVFSTYIPLSYLTEDQRIDTVLLNVIRNRLNEILAEEASVDATITFSGKIVGVSVTEQIVLLRKSAAIDHFICYLKKSLYAVASSTVVRMGIKGPTQTQAQFLLGPGIPSLFDVPTIVSTEAPGAANLNDIPAGFKRNGGFSGVSPFYIGPRKRLVLGFRPVFPGTFSSAKLSFVYQDYNTQQSTPVVMEFWKAPSLGVVTTAYFTVMASLLASRASGFLSENLTRLELNLTSPGYISGDDAMILALTNGDRTNTEPPAFSFTTFHHFGMRLPVSTISGISKQALFLRIYTV